MKRDTIRKLRMQIRMQQYFEDETVIQQDWLRNLVVCAKVLWFTIRMFISDRITTRASALTYSTLLSTVPLLAIVFAVAKGFGIAEHLQDLLLSNFKGQEEVIMMLMGSVNKYIEHTRSGLFLGVGFAMLIYTIMLLTGSIEETFNHLWQVKKARSPLRKLANYFSVLLLLPFLLVFISGFNVFLGTMADNMEEYVILGSTTRFFIRLIPYVVSSTLMTALYVFMPNTWVRFRSALIPGIVCGIAFQMFQSLYINSQIWVTNYNAIYGSFAAIPMFLIWTQTSWCICLFGAELTFSIQNQKTLGDRLDGKMISRADHDFACLLILSRIGKRFKEERSQDTKPYSSAELAEELGLPIRLVNKLIYELIRMRWIYALDHAKHETERYQLAWDLSNVTIEDVILTFDRDHERRVDIDRKDRFQHEWQSFCEATGHLSSLRKSKKMSDIFD
ncbi:MAG: YihY family inner membrane protein [Bacteroidaceae bacterium]|nr:YihY family inner membrane protein [Bacteroidaceae bacterium]